MTKLDSLKLSKNQMNSIFGGQCVTIMCWITYSDGERRRRFVNTTASREETEAELNAQGMGTYSASC